MVSIKDISLACGVSVATVSKALNNHKDVGEDTKEKIRKKAREMGYVPNFASKALKTNRTYNIGVVFADEAGSGLMHDHFARVLNSLKNELEIRGYDITFVNRNGNVSAWNNRMTYLEHCKYRRFDGAVILCTDFHDPEILELVESDIPVITFDHMFNDRSAVVSDAVKVVQTSDAYNHSAWESTSVIPLTLLENEPDDKVETYEKMNDAAETSCAAGFRFDKSDVEAEYSACVNVFDQYGFVLENGGYASADVDSVIDEYQSALDEAGYQDVLKEAQKQYDEWKAAK